MLRATEMMARLGGRTLLDGAALTLESGQVKGLVAPNGWGKTTLLRLLAGAHIRGCSGKLEIDGVSPGDERAFRREVFYAPGEGTLLYPDASARFHLESARRLWGSPYSVDDVARRCGIDDWLGRPVRKLSQGMRQQVTLAVAYMTHATYLLLDEPMNALDPTNVQRNSRLIRKVAEHGCAVIMSSHILDNVDRTCDSVLFLRDGLLMEAPGGGQGSLAMYEELYGGRGEVEPRRMHGETGEAEPRRMHGETGEGPEGLPGGRGGKLGRARGQMSEESGRPHGKRFRRS